MDRRKEFIKEIEMLQRKRARERVCVCVCVCVIERERKREREGERERNLISMFLKVLLKCREICILTPGDF